MFEEDEDLKSVIAFVQERVTKGTPAQYGEIHDHFGWGQTKWQRIWNTAKKYLDPRLSPKGGYAKYFVKQDFGKEVEKTLFSRDFLSRISAGDLHELGISVERKSKMAKEFSDALAEDMAWQRIKDVNYRGKIIETWQNKFRSTRACNGKLSKKDLEETSLPSVLMADAEIKEEAKKEAEASLTLAKYVKIRVISEKGESSPILSDQDIIRLLTIMFFSSVDPNTDRPRKSLHIVTSLEIPEEIHERAIALMKTDQQAHASQ